MAINFGNNTMKDICLGNIPLQRVHLGNNLVWQRKLPDGSFARTVSRAADFGAAKINNNALNNDPANYNYTWVAKNQAGVEFARYIGNKFTFDLSKQTGDTYLYLLDSTTIPTALQLFTLQIDMLDVSSFTNLEVLQADTNQIRKFDISKNTKLRRLNIYGNPITDIDISNNRSLNEVFVRECQLTSAAIDNLIIKLDSYGLFFGKLDYSRQLNKATRTAASNTAYNSLKNKSWTITE